MHIHVGFEGYAKMVKEFIQIWFYILSQLGLRVYGNRVLEVVLTGFEGNAYMI